MMPAKQHEPLSGIATCLMRPRGCHWTRAPALRIANAYTDTTAIAVLMSVAMQTQDCLFAMSRGIFAFGPEDGESRTESRRCVEHPGRDQYQQNTEYPPQRLSLYPVSHPNANRRHRNGCSHDRQETRQIDVADHAVSQVFVISHRDVAQTARKGDGNAQRTRGCGGPMHRRIEVNEGRHDHVAAADTRDPGDYPTADAQQRAGQAPRGPVMWPWFPTGEHDKGDKSRNTPMKPRKAINGRAVAIQPAR